MLFQTLVVGPFQCNCRILACPQTGEACVIDPGDEANLIIQKLESMKTSQGRPLQVKYLFHTHAHLDHVSATRELKEKSPSSLICLHQADEKIYENLEEQGEMFGIALKSPLPVEEYFEHEKEYEVGKLKFKMIHSPGHSPGSVGILLKENSDIQSPELLFSGDTLFQHSVGRTDLWGGDLDTLKESIKTRFFTLDDDIRVCPGHGPDTLIGVEKRENPFLI